MKNSNPDFQDLKYTETIKQRHPPFPGMGTPQPVIKWSKKAEITKCALRCQVTK